MIRRLIARHAPHDGADSAEVRALLAALARIPFDELPNGAARDALAEAIRCGEVDALYTPIGHARHNITLAGLPADVDPRLTVTQWAQWWLDGKSASEETLRAWRQRTGQGGQSR